jgi:hypothetical protein
MTCAFECSNLCSLFFDKPGPDSFGIVAVSHGCRGVAARACGLVNLEPTKVIAFISTSFIYLFLILNSTTMPAVCFQEKEFLNQLHLQVTMLFSC